MKLKALILSMFLTTLVLGCTKNEPAEETVPPAPEFEDSMMDDTMMDDTSMDENMDEGTVEEEDDHSM